MERSGNYLLFHVISEESHFSGCEELGGFINWQNLKHVALMLLSEIKMYKCVFIEYGCVLVTVPESL